MRKLFVIPFLFLISAGFVSCLDDSEPVFKFWNEPAIVDNLDEENPIIKTPRGKFTVPELEGKDVKEGDLLWTRFQVDMNKQGDKDLLVAEFFSYTKINGKETNLPQNTETFQTFLENDYSEPIRLAELYNYYIDHYLFFGFYHTNGAGKEFVYELVCNPEIESDNGNPTLYIRSKEFVYEEDDLRMAASQQNQDGKVVAAFQMTKFLEKYGKELNSGGKFVKFNLKYKTGVDKDGKDVYREFASNPISWSAK
jgi:hypothetical protein